MKCLELKDKEALKALEKEWHAYVTRGIEADSVRGCEEAGLLALRRSPARPFRARKMLTKAIEGGTKNPNTYLMMAGLLITGEGDEHEKPDLRRARETLQKAIELDPLVAESYAMLGDVCRLDGKADEGKKLRGLAHELDPDNPRYDPDRAATIVPVPPKK